MIPYVQEKSRVLEDTHGNCIHISIEQQILEIRGLGYYWPEIRNDVIHNQQKCIKCNSQAPSRLKKGMKPICSMYTKNIFVADLVEIHKSIAKGKYKYLFNMIDHFSKFGWSIIIENKESTTVAKCFNTIFQSCRPKILLTDNGTEFKGEVDILRKD